MKRKILYLKAFPVFPGKLSFSEPSTSYHTFPQQMELMQMRSLHPHQETPRHNIAAEQNRVRAGNVRG